MQLKIRCISGIGCTLRLSRKVNVDFVVMYDIAKWTDTKLDPTKKTDDIRTAWGYNPTIEYYPFNDLNLRFYANWVGRIYDYSDYATSRFKATDTQNGRFSIGIAAPLGIF